MNVKLHEEDRRYRRQTGSRLVEREPLDRFAAFVELRGFPCRRFELMDAWDAFTFTNTSPAVSRQAR